MYALRNLARAAPRSAARLSTAIRPQPSLLRSAALQPSWSKSVPRLTASFHLSAARRQESDVKEELVAKLQNEISMEEQLKDDEDLSTNISEYLSNSPFALEDKPGHQVINLTRTFGDEKIRVYFTTADLDSTPPDESDPALYDNEVDDIIDGQSGGGNTKGSINQGAGRDGNVRVAPEDQVAPADREELAEDYDEEGGQQEFPAHVSVRIERPGIGAMFVEGTVHSGDFIIEELYYLPPGESADPGSAEQDWQRRNLYIGPPFSNLDEDLQILLEKYLEERGINTRMALFIPDYIDHKEQKEYINWLQNMKKFVG
ncbi:regulatory protein-like protein suaprga1 [Massarina eburnea CBS 473.64]|uniref:Regulatory protein-like protein suaprga1 n=1 Tax=Massarina eburnea CBS 473.64 TaxID=1395130 RepID=A0A6A6S2T8_9PLEO|nr:regulatory protein-like protein suaprga1 [Massarina eburnea CBS 473.64]